MSRAQQEALGYLIMAEELRRVGHPVSVLTPDAEVAHRYAMQRHDRLSELARSVLRMVALIDEALPLLSVPELSRVQHEMTEVLDKEVQARRVQSLNSTNQEVSQ